MTLDLEMEILNLKEEIKLLKEELAKLKENQKPAINPVYKYDPIKGKIVNIHEKENN